MQNFKNRVTTKLQKGTLINKNGYFINMKIEINFFGSAPHEPYNLIIFQKASPFHSEQYVGKDQQPLL